MPKKILLELPSYATQFTIDGPFNPDTELSFTGYNIRRLKISKLRFRVPEAGHHTLTIRLEGNPSLANFNQNQYYDGETSPYTIEPYFKSFMLPDNTPAYIDYINENADYWDYVDLKQDNLLIQLEIYIKIDGQDTPLITPTNKLYMELEFE